MLLNTIEIGYIKHFTLIESGNKEIYSMSNEVNFIINDPDLGRGGGWGRGGEGKENDQRRS